MRKKIFIIALVLSTLNINGSFAQESVAKSDKNVVKTQTLSAKPDVEPSFEAAPASSVVVKESSKVSSENKTVPETVEKAVIKKQPQEKKVSNKKFSFFKFKKEKQTESKAVVNAEQKVKADEIQKPVEQKPAASKKQDSQKPKKAKKKEKLQKEETIEASSAPTLIQGSVEAHAKISIDDCIKAALANNPNILSAVSNAEIYKSKIAQAWAAYFPTFGANLGYSRNDMLITNFSFPNQTYNMYQVPNITANMLLFDFGKTKVKADMAKKNYQASQDNVQSSINEVVYNVKSAYYNLLFAVQQEKVYADTVKDYETHLAQAKAYYSIGTKPKIDVITAEYNLGNAKLNRIKAKNTIEMAYAQLNNAMGLPEYANYDVIDKFDCKAYNVDFEETIKKAYETRPEYLAAIKKADGSKLLVRASLRAFAPDINAFGSYTSGGKTASNDYGYQIGGQLSYTTTNLFLLKKQTDEAKATYKKDVADLEKTKQNVYLEVKQAYIQLNNAKESVPVARLSMQNAKEQYDLASGRYKVGLGDVIELKDAETTYRNAQLEYYNSLLNYNTAAANLERVVGVPLQTVADATQSL